MTDETPTDAPAADRLPAWLGARWVSALSLGLAAVAVSAALLPNLPGAFDARVRGYLLAHPEMLQEMSMALEQNQAQARADVINQAAAANPALLAPGPMDVAFGPADARVTVIEFFDFRCPGCKAVAPEYLALIRSHPDVRFVFKDWPILDREGEDVSHYAARAALIAHRQGRYLAVYEAFMAEPTLDQAAVERILTENGVVWTPADLDDPAVTRHLADVEVAGRALGLVGTPTFFINGRTTVSINPAEVDQAIAAAKAGA